MNKITHCTIIAIFLLLQIMVAAAVYAAPVETRSAIVATLISAEGALLFGYTLMLLAAFKN